MFGANLIGASAGELLDASGVFWNFGSAFRVVFLWYRNNLLSFQKIFGPKKRYINSELKVLGQML